MSLRKGSDFKDVKLFKILRKDLTHYGYAYKEGLNVLEGKFHPEGDCQPGGFYITQHPERWIALGTLLAPVTLPDDAQVWEVPDTKKLKVDKLVLGKWFDIPESVYLQSVQEPGFSLETIPENRRSLPICIAAVKNHGYEIPSVPKMHRTHEMYLVAVQRDGENLAFVPHDHLTPSICLAAVQQNGRALYYIPENQRDATICLAAVKRNGYALQHVPWKERTEIVCRAAGRSDFDVKYAIDLVPKEIQHLFL